MIDGELMAFRINLELLVSHDVLHAVKEYDINIPEVCINGIVSEIERLHSISKAISTTTASKDIEIQELKAALRFMREKLEMAEASNAPRRLAWHK
jgi:hypothetical protein